MNGEPKMKLREMEKKKNDQQVTIKSWDKWKKENQQVTIKSKGKRKIIQIPDEAEHRGWARPILKRRDWEQRRKKTETAKRRDLWWWEVDQMRGRDSWAWMRWEWKRDRGARGMCDREVRDVSKSERDSGV